MIKETDVQSVLDASRIDEVVGDFVQLKKRGANYLGLCPFHDEKTPSFVVSPAKGIYKCFGCGRAGNASKFLMDHEQISFPEAIHHLANKYNIQIEEEAVTEERKKEISERESLFIINNFAISYFQEQMNQTDEGKAIALSYFNERGYREDTIEKFQLGYCSEQWDGFTTSALEKGYDIKRLEETGLTIVKEEKKFDRFRNRVIFPIHNVSGKVIGFGGRVLSSSSQQAKYLNSPESIIFNKSKNLYGLHLAKNEIVKQDLCYVVEGYTDVISLAQSGIQNVVAPLGTALTEEHLVLIRRYTENVTLLFDGDAAGIKAANRSIDMALEQGLNVRLIAFEEGQDPDSFAMNHTSDEITDFLQNKSMDFIAFKEFSTDIGDDPIRKARFIKEIASSLGLIADTIKRSVYIQMIAEKFGIDESILISEVNYLRRKKRKKSQGGSEQEEEIAIPVQQDANASFKKWNNAEERLEHIENDLIRLIINHGHENIHVKISREGPIDEIIYPVGFFIIEQLLNDDISFKNEEYNVLVKECIAALEAGMIPDTAYYLNHPAETITHLASSMVIAQHELSENWWKKHKIHTQIEEENLYRSVTRVILALKNLVVHHQLDDLSNRMKDALSEPEKEELLKYHMRLTSVKKIIANKQGTTITR